MEYLPVENAREAILEAWRKDRGLLLIAPPGTGKSTRVPLMAETVAEGKKVVCLQPRRVAVRSLATRVASERGEAAGQSIGYRMRLERSVSPETRVEYVTYGVFWREILQGGGIPSDVGVVLLDEFHERSLEMDLVFGWLASVRGNTEKGPQFALLSATITPEKIHRLLPHLPVVRVEAPLYPVERRHLPRPSRFDPLKVVERAVAATTALAQEIPSGDLLVFLPGYREIRRLIEDLGRVRALRDREILPLSGEQSGEDQDRAVRGGDLPRIIVATNIAETSVTIEGLRGVIDSGLYRRMEFDPGRGVNALRTERISLHSADQRSGRAGRQGPGVCLRLWSVSEEAEMERESPAEILGVDLTEVFLGLAAARVRDPIRYPWIDLPSERAWSEAKDLLLQLGAIQEDGSPTGKGHALAQMPVHPRLGACFLRAAELQVPCAGAALVGVIQEGHLFRRGSRSREKFWEKEDDAEFRADLRGFDHFLANGAAEARSLGISVYSAKAVRQTTERLLHLVGNSKEDRAANEIEDATLARSLLAGYPDRLAKLDGRGLATGKTSNGQAVRTSREGWVRPEEWFLPLHLREVFLEGVRTVLAEDIVRIDPRWIEEDLAERIQFTEKTAYDSESGLVMGIRERRIGILSLDMERTEITDSGIRSKVLASMEEDGEIQLAGWDEAVAILLARYELLRNLFPELELEDFGQEERRLVIETLATRARTLREFKRLPVLPILREFLGPEVIASLDYHLPEGYSLPRRKRLVPVDYLSDQAPKISSRLQDFIGLPDHPSLADGRLPLVVELLAPSRRPIQITSDLPTFWKTSYPAIKKEIKGRYPKHHWP